ncbi:hypothetical protein B0H11DRAFT_2115157 [Mycena galericulata]|nr:hypothetical protein B0H11DRAFT_2115157 [Mycena galericulata]
MVRTLLNWVLPQILFILTPASTPAPSRLPGILESPAHCHQHRCVPDTHPVSFTFLRIFTPCRLALYATMLPLPADRPRRTTDHTQQLRRWFTPLAPRVQCQRQHQHQH